MRDDRPIDAQQGGGATGDPETLDQYLEQYLEHLDGTRTTAPSPRCLTKAEQAEARNAVRLFKLHWGAELTPTSAEIEETYAHQYSTDPWDVLVWHHTADRGWANWIILELENAGFRCRPAAFDRAELLQLNAVEHAQIIAVVSSVMTTCYQGGYYADDHLDHRSDTPFLRPDSVDENRLLAVRVEDCEPPDLLNGITPTCWLDLVGHNETAARKALLERVTGQPAHHNEDPDQSCQQLTMIHVLLDKVPPRPMSRSTPAGDERSLNDCRNEDYQDDDYDEVLPPLLRATLHERLGRDPNRWLYLAEELCSLARVKIALGSVDQAHEVHQQARGIRALFNRQATMPSCHRQQRQPISRSSRQELLSWPIADCATRCN